MALVLKGSQFYLPTPRSSANGMNHIPAFAFSAEAGTHLLTPERWKAELALGGWLVTYIHIEHKPIGADLLSSLIAYLERR